MVQKKALVVRLIYILVLYGTISPISAQKFSVLTCGKGAEVYSTFGHSAIRYQDTSLGIDEVYNYGLFEFSDPNFIPKFCKGKLDYMVGKESMNDFMPQYIYQGREVREQVLNLNSMQRDSLRAFLEWNILDQNKYYRYDFLFNNCATKIIDVLEKNCKGIQMNFYQEKDKESFRELIHRYARNSVPVIDFGMDIGLGTPTDRNASPREYCFLPDYVEKSLVSSMNTMIDKPLVMESNIVLEQKAVNQPTNTKLFLLAFFFLPILLFKQSIRWVRWLLGTYYIILGIAGLILLFLWFGTEHTVTKWNWNLGWMNPIAILVGISMIFRKLWLPAFYALLLFCIFALVGVLWTQGLDSYVWPKILASIAGIYFYMKEFKNFSK